MRKVAGERKICRSISPMLKTPNFKLKLAHFLPNAVRHLANLCTEKSFSSCARKKALRAANVGEIDPLSFICRDQRFIATWCCYKVV